MNLVERVQDKKKTREHDKRHRLEALLGGNVLGARFTDVRKVSSEIGADWVETRYIFTTSSGEEAAGVTLFPKNASGAIPAILYCHAHGFRYETGAEELLNGAPSLVAPFCRDKADFCREMGHVCPAILAIDMPAFASRQTPLEDARAKAHGWSGTTLFGEMLADLTASVTFLAEHPQIDAARIGAYGFSMGSTLAFWLAALDERVKASVALCSFADLATLIKLGAHDGHGHYMTVPGLTREFSTGEIAGLAAPRALMIGAGMQDWSTPPEAFEIGKTDLQAAFADQPDQLAIHVERETGHLETPAMREAALTFLERHLWH